MINMIMKLVSLGWIAFCLPFGAKFPPPAGITGKSAAEGEELDSILLDQVDTYQRGRHNIGIRMPKGVIGIDIDNIEDEKGRQIRDACAGSYRISSGDGNDRFTALFLVPEGFEYGSLMNLPGVVDLITPYHRYSVIGRHPSGRTYSIYGPAGEVLDTLPDVRSLTTLPDSVVKLMERPRRVQITRTVQSRTKGAESPAQSEMEPFENPACAHSVRVFNKGTENIPASTSRHNAFLSSLWALNQENQKGHSIGGLLSTLRECFIEAVNTPERAQEFDRMVKGLDWSDMPCEVCSVNNGAHINKNLLTSSGQEMNEIENELWIKSRGTSFPTEAHRISFEKLAAKNMMLDKIKKDENRRRAERAYITSLDTHNNGGSSLIELIEAVSADEKDKKAAMMIALGYEKKEIAETIGVSAPTLRKRLKQMGERAKNGIQ